MIITLKSDKLTVSISTLGAELISAVGSDGHEYVYTGRHWSGHAPILFPVCGSLLDDRYTLGGTEYAMAKHGFARRSEFEVVSESENEATLALRASEATRVSYPFEFELIAHYALTGERLAVDFTVKNESAAVMPYMLGWHPAFTLGGQGEIGGFCLDFGVDGPFVMHPLNGGPFLSGEKVEFPLTDGCYRLNEKQIYDNDTLILTGTDGEARLYGAGDIHEVTLTWSDNLPYFCIWKWPDSEARYLCLEPWSGVPADGVTAENFDTREMSRLGAGESEVYSYTVEFGK